MQHLVRVVQRLETPYHPRLHNSITFALGTLLPDKSQHASPLTDARKARLAEGATAAESANLFRFPTETVVALLGFAILWEVLSYFLPPFAVPSWSHIAPAFLKLRFDYVAVTVMRVVGAMAVSFLVGLGIAVVMYRFNVIERYGMPIVRLLMAIPVVCWVVFAILWFKGVEFRIFFVLFIVCGPVFVIDLLDGMKTVHVELRDMLSSFRPSAWQMFSILIIPGSLPNMLTSWKINLTLAIRVVTIAELVGATTGIGYGLVVAQETFSITEVFAWTVVLVAILFLFHMILDLLEKRLLRWRV